MKLNSEEIKNLILSLVQDVVFEYDNRLVVSIHGVGLNLKWVIMTL